MKRMRWLVWFLIGLMAWGCHYPGARTPTSPQPLKLPVEHLRLTLEALHTPSATASRAPTSSPGSTPSPFSTQPTNTLPLPSGPATVTAPPGMTLYTAQAGDTLPALAGRFGVAPEQIRSLQPLAAQGLIPQGQLLLIPTFTGEAPYAQQLLPDGALVNGPSAAGFDIRRFIQQAGGYLSVYQESFNGEDLTGAEAVERVAVESSINPRLLLAVLEYRSGWVFGQPKDARARTYPLGFQVTGSSGLYRELVMAATHLNSGYYGWRQGVLTSVKAADGVSIRLHPTLNAGSVAVQNLLAKFYPSAALAAALEGPDSLMSRYQQMFGDPWVYERQLGPLLPDNLQQPILQLPFPPGERWSLTGGPHESWKTGTPRGAIDLAPVTGEAECAVSRLWVTAPAAGLVVRSERNALALDLDGDGLEQTGWVLFFYHLAEKERLAAGTWVQLDDRLGHPSCEGGRTTGTHVHLARKFNGEWLAADGPIPFVLSGWLVVAGEKNYSGELRLGDQVVIASPLGPRTSIIVRQE